MVEEKSELTLIHKNHKQTSCIYHQFSDESSNVLPTPYRLCGYRRTSYKYELLDDVQCDHKML